MVLRHIEYMISSFGGEWLKGDFKRFLVGWGEASYLKSAKVRILEKLIGKDNHADIVNELAECLYQEDIGAETAAALTRVLLKSAESEARFIAKTVVRVVEDCPKSHLCNSVLPLVRNYLRLYPKDFPIFAAIFYSLVESAKEEIPRCCAIEIVGDFGEMIEDAI